MSKLDEPTTTRDVVTRLREMAAGLRQAAAHADRFEDGYPEREKAAALETAARVLEAEATR